MKKITYQLLFILPALLMTACVKDEADVFEKDTAQRIDEALKADVAFLTGATNGWLGYYYPEKEYSAGGYAMSWKFSPDGKAAIACDATLNGVPGGEEAISYWTVKQEQGPTLSFDLYNPILHHFCQASNADLDGLGGDYEFIITRTTQDSIFLTGKKNKNLLTLYKAPDDDPLGYVRQISPFVEETGKHLKSFDLTVNGVTEGTATVVMTPSARTLTLTYKVIVPAKTEDGEDTDEQVTDKLTFTCTATGFKLSRPYTFKGVTVQEFVWDEGTLKYTSPGTNVELNNPVVLLDLRITGLEALKTSISATFISDVYKAIPILDQGIVYSLTKTNLTINGNVNVKSFGTTPGVYPFTLTELEIGSMYYARAYVQTPDTVYYATTTEFSTYIAYEEYLGDYTMHYSSSTSTTTPNKTLDVSLVEGKDENTYYLKGVLTEAQEASIGNLVVQYRPASCDLLFPINLIGKTALGYDFYAIAYLKNNSTGAFASSTTLTSGYGLLSYEYDEATGSFNTKSTAVGTTYTTIGFRLRNYNNGSNAGDVSGRDGQYNFFYLKFVKK